MKRKFDIGSYSERLVYCRLAQSHMKFEDYGNIVENRVYGPRDAGNIKFKNIVERVNGHCMVTQVFRVPAAKIYIPGSLSENVVYCRFAPCHLEITV